MTAVIRVVEGRPRDLGGFSVRRVLPAGGLQTVGPFIFFDHMGPAVFAPGSGVDVRPHPHIGLATVTYLFEGEFMHRDSLGIGAADPSGRRELDGGRPWHRAFRADAAGGAPRRRARRSTASRPGSRCRGARGGCAVVRASSGATLPEIRGAGALLRLIAGAAFGQQRAGSVFSPMFYLEAELEAGATVELPDALRGTGRLRRRGRDRGRGLALRCRPDGGVRAGRRRPRSVRRRRRGSCCSAARRSTARARSGGTSFRAARAHRAGEARLAAKIASRRCQATTNASRCRSYVTRAPLLHGRRAAAAGLARRTSTTMR